MTSFPAGQGGASLGETVAKETAIYYIHLFSVWLEMTHRLGVRFCSQVAGLYTLQVSLTDIHYLEGKEGTETPGRQSLPC